MHGHCLRTTLGHRKNACILHIAYCMMVKGILCVMRCHNVTIYCKV